MKEMRDKDKLIIDEFVLFDDEYAKVFFNGQKKCTQEVLRVILNKSDLEVIECKVQDEHRTLLGHAVVFDIIAVDGNGDKYNIEIQRSPSGAIPKRAAFYSALLLSNALKKGESYDDLRECYTIFIAEEDVFKKGLSVYKIERCFENDGEPFNDGVHIVYVNGAYLGDDPVGHLMSDFRENVPEKMHYKALRERAQYLKKSNEEKVTMTDALKQYRQELVEQGIEQGIEQGRREAEAKYKARIEELEAQLKKAQQG